MSSANLSMSLYSPVQDRCQNWWITQNSSTYIHIHRFWFNQPFFKSNSTSIGPKMNLWHCCVRAFCKPLSPNIVKALLTDNNNQAKHKTTLQSMSNSLTHSFLPSFFFAQTIVGNIPQRHETLQRRGRGSFHAMLRELVGMHVPIQSFSSLIAKLLRF